MSRWEPEDYSDNEIADAIYNLAAGAHALAKAADGLIYALKYSKDQGLSVAEAIEVGAKAVASALDGIGSEVSNLDTSVSVAGNAIERGLNGAWVVGEARPSVAEAIEATATNAGRRDG